jgi:hypothetical protein
MTPGGETPAEALQEFDRTRIRSRTGAFRFATWAEAMLTSPYPSLKSAFGEFVR